MQQDLQSDQTPRRLFPPTSTPRRNKAAQNAPTTPSTLRPPRRRVTPHRGMVTPGETSIFSSRLFGNTTHNVDDDFCRESDDSTRETEAPLMSSPTSSDGMRTPSPSAESRTALVAFQQDAIAQTPSKEENDRWLANFGIDIALLRLVNEQYGPLLRAKRESNPEPASLPATSVTDVTDEVQDVVEFNEENDSPAIVVPIANSAQLVPAGFDKSGLGGANRTENATPLFIREETVTPPTPPSQHMALREITPTRRPTRIPRAPRTPRTPRTPRDIPLILPSQLAPTQIPRITKQGGDLAERRKRRSSARVCMRELQDLNATPQDAKYTTGSTVFLTPVRATRKQRDMLGTDTIVTPVRRSLRLSRRYQPAVNTVADSSPRRNTDDGEPSSQDSQQLVGSDDVYAPNEHLLWH